ncbi:MAG TPA: RNA-binding S4 domain-containing protein [Candidatus Avipropionibacterium avicola]|uniref:RNA-binding S4 domain-containing protein n=1 Tax=Candidatus Avipropionibacterium avicola TaxID=2840701 RepID=A0A9D1KNE9_9ACTN|nr:RNA-binding S4 domain-containing protein [Candidatus Avipropionibacterium avicola]
MSNLAEVAIRDESIRLGQLLKLADLVEDGATARAVIENGEVSIDGQVETRRGAQVRPGQVVSCGDTSIRVTDR